QMHIRSLEKFITRLKGIVDDDAYLFDRTQILFGSGMGNGSSHSNKNLPVLVAGGDLNHTGKDIIFEEGKTPLCNVFVTMLQKLGIETEKFANSTGNINNELA
ncbi:MAG: hypothetical protein HOJ89_12205, partial [Opitutales bacterium]|nr:hypothetical protein [Opitutales bacterium]